MLWWAVHHSSHGDAHAVVRPDNLCTISKQPPFRAVIFTDLTEPDNPPSKPWWALHDAVEIIVADHTLTLPAPARGALAERAEENKGCF